MSIGEEPPDRIALFPVHEAKDGGECNAGQWSRWKGAFVDWEDA